MLFLVIARFCDVGGYEQLNEVGKHLRNFFLKTLDMSVD